ncbi:MAG: inner membrane CreD family protein [Luteibacter sp.]
MFHWTHTITAKVPGIGMLALSMLIPMFMADGLVRGRQAMRDAASARVAGGWSGPPCARRAGLTLGGVLALVYAILYGLIGAEQYALLIGSVVLVAVVALLMYLTRRIDWYAQGVPLQPTSDTP